MVRTETQRGPAAKYCDGLRQHELDRFSAVRWPAANRPAVSFPDFAPAFELPALTTAMTPRSEAA